MSENASRALYILCCVLFFSIELTYFIGLKPLEDIAGITWLFLSVVVLLSFIYAAFAPFFGRDFWKEPGAIFFFIVALLPAACVCVDLEGITFSLIDGEGVFQMLEAKRVLATEPGHGIFSVGYFRYPARGILINYLPHFFFPRCITTLRLSHNYLSLLGCVFFMQAIRSYLKSLQNPLYNLWACFAGSSSFLTEYGIMYMRKFDLTNSPLGAHCLILGALLLNYQKHDWLKHIWILWLLGYLAGGYTPCWGTLLLIFSYFLYEILLRRHYRFFILLGYGLLSLSTQVLCTYVTITGKMDHPHDMTVSDWVWRYFCGLSGMFGRPEFVPAPLVIGVFLTLYLAIRRKNVIPFLVTGWALLMMILVFTLAGTEFDWFYDNYCKALIVLPTLALLCTCYLPFLLKVENLPDTGLRVIRLGLGAGTLYTILLGIQMPFAEPNFSAYGPDGNAPEALFDFNQIEWDSTKDKPTALYISPEIDVPEDQIPYFLSPMPNIYHQLPSKELNLLNRKGVYVMWVIKHDGYNSTYPSKASRPYLAIREITSDPASWKDVPTK